MANRLVFFGNERLATGVTTDAPVLQALIVAGYEVAAVVVAQKTTGSSRKQRPLEVAEIAEKYGVPVLAPLKFNDAFDEITAMKADAAILVAYGKLIPSSVIGAFPQGIINIHPSLLPLHRGSIPIESVIRSGELKTGVSLMQLAEQMDAGPVYDQQQIALTGHETKQQLADQLAQLGRDMLLEHLPNILHGDMEPSPQNDTSATYDERLTKDMAVLDFKKSAAVLEKQIRAYIGWPRSTTQISNTEVIVLKAHHIEGSGAAGALWLSNKQIGFYCDTGILVIDELIPQGKKAMSASAFLAGYHPSDDLL